MSDHGKLSIKLQLAEEEVERLRAENARLREALKPFAATARGVPDNWPGESVLTFVKSSYPSERSGKRHVYVSTISLDADGEGFPTIAQWRAAAALEAKP